MYHMIDWWSMLVGGVVEDDGLRPWLKSWHTMRLHHVRQWPRGSINCQAFTILTACVNRPIQYAIFAWMMMMMTMIRDRPKFGFSFGYGEIFSFGYSRNRDAWFRPTFGYCRDYHKVSA